MDSAGVNGVGTSTGGIPNVAGSLITNADQGAVYSWGACITNPNTGQCTPQYSLTTIAADGTPSTVQTNIGASSGPISPYLIYPVQPVLQRADGSYIGTTSMFNASSFSNAMVAFTSSGQQLWSQPNYSPQIATDDGGVIAQSQSGQSVTFDANGNQTGQSANINSTPTQYNNGQWPSWAGYVYEVLSDASVGRLVPPPALLVANLLQTAGGNVSKTGTSLNLLDDPWSLRLVPVKDDGADHQAYRNILYKLRKLDGKSKPNGQWYITEHQTNHSVAPPNGMSGGDELNQFDDLIGCLACQGIQSKQTFSISPRQGIYPSPSYDNIIVHVPALGDFGVLGCFDSRQGNRINGLLRWPGVPAIAPSE